MFGIAASEFRTSHSVGSRIVSLNPSKAATSHKIFFLISNPILEFSESESPALAAVTVIIDTRQNICRRRVKIDSENFT